MARNERSAGFVVFRRDGKNPRKYLLLNYGQHWDYPKGHIEGNEDDLEAAIRELREETGIEQPDEIFEFRHELSYFFRGREDHQLVRKTVVFFLAEVGFQKIVLSEEHVGYEFLKFDDALKRLTFANAKELLRRAQEFLTKHDAESRAHDSVSGA